ncbi:hypothetical protein F4778DRAFT_729306 [Xylariomycetidae sp. FL2044]|nr:hypothetical protein F4778DRAFT_729306 [Xylariomycetidae sp. FL2044]
MVCLAMRSVELRSLVPLTLFFTTAGKSYGMVLIVLFFRDARRVGGDVIRELVCGLIRVHHLSTLKIYPSSPPRLNKTQDPLAPSSHNHHT